MNVWSRGNNDRIEVVESKHFFQPGAGMFRAEVARDFFRLGPFATLDGDEFGIRMRFDGGNVRGRCPPACSNDSDTNFFHDLPLNGTSKSRFNSTPNPGLPASSETFPF